MGFFRRRFFLTLRDNAIPTVLHGEDPGIAMEVTVSDTDTHNSNSNHCMHLMEKWIPQLLLHVLFGFYLFSSKSDLFDGRPESHGSCMIDMTPFSLKSRPQNKNLDDPNHEVIA